MAKCKPQFAIGLRDINFLSLVEPINLKGNNCIYRVVALREEYLSIVRTVRFLLVLMAVAW